MKLRTIFLVLILSALLPVSSDAIDLDELCRGSVIETIRCSRRDTVLIIIEVVVDSVVVEEGPGNQGFLMPPPEDEWNTELFFGLARARYAMTVTDSIGNSRLWTTRATTGRGTWNFIQPPRPWSRELDLLSDLVERSR